MIDNKKPVIKHMAMLLIGNLELSKKNAFTIDFLKVFEFFTITH